MRVLFITSWAFGEAVAEQIRRRGHELVGLVAHPSIQPPFISLQRALWDGPAALAARRSVRLLSFNKSIKGMASDFKVPWIQRGDLNAPGIIEGLRNLKPDCILVMGWPRILSSSVAEGLGSKPINAHPSLLPGHRGQNPFSSVLRTGERRTGWSFHLMTEAPDAGDILLQRSIPVRQDDDGLTLQIRLCMLAREIVPELLDGLERGGLDPRPQGQGASWYPALSEKDRPVDWARPASAICDQVRALYPWTTATTRWKGRTVLFDRCRVLRRSLPRSRPGLVVGVTPRGLLVAAREGALWIGGIRLPGLSLIRSQIERWRAIRAGDILN